MPRGVRVRSGPAPEVPEATSHVRALRRGTTGALALTWRGWRSSYQLPSGTYTSTKAAQTVRKGGPSSPNQPTAALCAGTSASEVSGSTIGCQTWMTGKVERNHLTV